ncbi:hypothetical protein [Glutamicibacter sp. NPDC087344]|uniref:hypothetical protein n=1 Tax=Glutamicibacter sp. NPDC087344 TaxID=3363994 RepID=UPI00382D24FF
MPTEVILEVRQIMRSKINPYPQMIRSRKLAWLGVGTALFSLFFTYSMLAQFICLTLGAILFIMAAQRLPGETISMGLPARKFLVLLLTLAAGSFVLRFGLLLALSTPARYADYLQPTGPQAIGGIAASTTLFTLISMLVMLGVSLGAALALFGRKQRST